MLPSPKMLKKLLAREWDLIIADEAHSLCHRDTKRTRAVFGSKCDGATGLKSKAKRLWLLSGTPLPNNLSEGWTYARALFPDAVVGLERYSDWVDHFCITLDTDYGTRIVGAKRTDDFIRRFKPYTLRRRVEDVVKDLPSLRVASVVVEPDKLPPRPKELDEVEIVVRAALAKSAAGKTDEAKAAMREAQSLHIASLRKWTGVAKAEAVAEVIRNDFKSGLDKIVVFAVHRDVIDTLAKRLPGVAVIDGRTPMKKRDEIIDAFQGKPSKYPLKVISLLAHIDIASTALTLTAACHIAFAETTWTPKDVQQAICRCYRIGQKRPVLARIFSLKGSVDEQIGATLARKTSELSRIDEALAA